MSERGNKVVTQIRKRDGRIVEFDAERITLAAAKALKAAGTENQKLAKTICKDVIQGLSEVDFADSVPDIELVQDFVEQSFIKRGLSKAAKLYILYRAQHDKIREKTRWENGKWTGRYRLRKRYTGLGSRTGT